MNMKEEIIMSEIKRTVTEEEILEFCQEQDYALRNLAGGTDSEEDKK